MKKMNKSLWSLVLAVALMGAAAGAEDADEKTDKSGKPGTPLRVQVTFTRFQGEKKVSSMPYTLAVNADDRPTVVRTGIQVPLLVFLSPEKGSTIMYKDVGNNLDCGAETLADGRYKLSFSLEQGSVHSTDANPKSPTEPAAFHAPVLRHFRSQTNVILRDGQSVQYVAATDPVSGELLKIDVTMNVVK
jgi:Flp pilus assembly secretin CpaC